MNTKTNKRVQASLASPWKRLFAYIYDWLPLAGVFVLFFATGTAIANLIWYNTPADQVSEIIRNHPVWWVYLIISSGSYYVYCWVKGGQTVGMRTWRIKLVDSNGDRLTLIDSIVRAFLSAGGLANIWSIFDANYRGWHDIAVDAYLVQLPKMEKTKEEQKPLI
ncbi:MAG: RDD family protein [Gammaproteobacteria bacterium]|nr:RDD family protein [Gammaproteobacteria bacterium]